MAPTATIIIPTQDRPAYLDVALSSIVPQARAAGADVLVVDDGPSAATASVARTHGARYVAHDAPRGLNAARNTALAATDAELLVFVDDDVRVHPGWLAALLGAAAEQPGEVGVLTGPIVARFEDHALRMCGRENPPITTQDLGDRDVDAPHAWGANMAVRRSAIDRVGPFAAAGTPFARRGRTDGDEQEWQERLRAAGGRIRYVATAGVDHRRAGDDSRLRALCREAYARGRAARRHDAFAGRAPSLRAELRVLAGCLAHGPRHRCANGIVLSAQSWGRTREAWAPEPAPATPGVDDFLSGASGTVGGLRGRARRLRDLAADAWTAPARARARHRAAAAPVATVLVIGIDRPGSLMPAALDELRRSHHDLTIVTAPMTAGRGKFANLDALLEEVEADAFDWVLVLDDDVHLPRGFLDVLIDEATRAGLHLAQPAHRHHSHAAWPVTRRGGAGTRRTTFVEIGPVTLFGRAAVRDLLPFPAELQMGWGLDAHWAALARERGWRLGVVDAVPVAHTVAPAGAAYSREAALAEARAFLADRPYLRRDEIGEVGA